MLRCRLQSSCRNEGQPRPGSSSPAPTRGWKERSSTTKFPIGCCHSSLTGARRALPGLRAEVSFGVGRCRCVSLDQGGSSTMRQARKRPRGKVLFSTMCGFHAGRTRRSIAQRLSPGEQAARRTGVIRSRCERHGGCKVYQKGLVIPVGNVAAIAGSTVRSISTRIST